MAFPFLALAQLAASLGELGYGLFAKPGLSDQMQKYIDLLNRRAEEGIPSGVESSMMRSGLRQISRQTAAMQSRGAAALASQGVSRSSAARGMISSINRTQGDMFVQLQESIRRMDEQVKMQAAAQLGQATSMAESSLAGQQASKGMMIGRGIAGLLDKELWSGLGLMDEEITDLEKNLKLIRRYFPEAADQTEGSYQIDMLMLQELLQKLFAE